MGDGSLSKNLVLVGGRGCGKSGVSRRLQRMEKRFSLFPLDALISYESGGRSIPEIVADQGWHGFRDVERSVVGKVGSMPGGALVDCGGGVVVELDADGNEVYGEGKVAALREHGLVVYLERDPAYLAERIAGDPNRPSLSSAESFFEIMARRDPWYRRAAHLTLPCTGVRKTEIAERVLAWFREQLDASSASA